MLPNSSFPHTNPPPLPPPRTRQTNFPVPEVTIANSSPAAHRGYADGFLSQLAHKDLVLALSAARAVDSPLFTGELTEKVYRTMMEQQGEAYANRDFSIVYKWLDEVVQKGSAKPV